LGRKGTRGRKKRLCNDNRWGSTPLSTKTGPWKGWFFLVGSGYIGKKNRGEGNLMDGRKTKKKEIRPCMPKKGRGVPNVINTTEK